MNKVSANSNYLYRLVLDSVAIQRNISSSLVYHVTTLTTLLSRDAHNISRKNISPNALKVLYRLHDKGFRACLVGGGVRDLLLNLQPKDFDVATDATPEQVRQLFNNCRLIGRRFKLAHVRYGREIIEVATFRGSAESSAENENSEQETKNFNAKAKVASDLNNIAINETVDFDDSSIDWEEYDKHLPNGNVITSEKRTKKKDSKKSAHQIDSDGFVTRDNVYGTIEEDAVRRDLTINSLYYDINDFSIIDYCGGAQDLKDGVIRLIGNPETRYREDPVRMLRVIRFASKLDFTIESETEKAIHICAALLDNIPASRLIDESLKLLMGGKATTNYQQLRKYNLFYPLFPFTEKVLKKATGPQLQYFEQFINIGLQNSDNRVADGKTITPYYLLAVLFWAPVIYEIQPLLKAGISYQDAIFEVSEKILSEQQAFSAIPRRFSTPMREVWLIQPRLEKIRGKKAEKLLTHPRFRAAYDFMLLRALAGEALTESVTFWTEIQQDSELYKPTTAQPEKRVKSYRNRKPNRGRSKPA